MKKLSAQWFEMSCRRSLQDVFGRGGAGRGGVSPVPDMEKLLEVNLNFQVQLTVILAFGIFPRSKGSGSSLLKYNDSSPFLLEIFAELD